MDDETTFAVQCLEEAKDILESLGIPFCLFLGTALGAFRDHDFCPGDKDDIDLAVHQDHYIYRDLLIQRFAAQGFAAHIYQHDLAVSHELAFTREERGMKCKVDIFFVVPSRGDLIWTFYTAEGPQNRHVKNFMNSFDMTTFHGELYNLPYPIHDYLEANYGKNWKTPIHRSNWQWDKDNQAPMI